MSTNFSLHTEEIETLETEIIALEKLKDETSLKSALKLWRLLHLKFLQDKTYTMAVFESYVEERFHFNQKKKN